MAGVAVIIAHERLGAAQDVALRIIEGGGDDALQLERELVGALAGVVVELVADAVEEIVGFLDFLAGGGGEEFSFDEILEVGAAGFHPCDPLDAVIIPHAAAAFLDVGFLQENGAGILFMAAAEVLAAEFEEGVLALVDALLGEAGLELLEQPGVAGDQAGVHQRGFVFLVDFRLLDALGDGAAGMADLEADVPKQVEHVLDEFLQGLREFVGGARQEEKNIDVRARIEQGAAVAAGGDERDRQRGALLAGVERGFQDRGEHDVDQGRAVASDFETAGPRAVVLEDAVLLDFEELLVEGDALRRRKLAFDGWLECFVGVLFERLEVVEHVAMGP